jgi:hypothetical protein
MVALVTERSYTTMCKGHLSSSRRRPEAARRSLAGRGIPAARTPAPARSRSMAMRPSWQHSRPRVHSPSRFLCPTEAGPLQVVHRASTARAQLAPWPSAPGHLSRSPPQRPLGTSSLVGEMADAPGTFRASSCPARHIKGLEGINLQRHIFIKIIIEKLPICVILSQDGT